MKIHINKKTAGNRDIKWNTSKEKVILWKMLRKLNLENLFGPYYFSCFQDDSQPTFTCQQWKHRNSVWILLRVNNKDTRKTSVTLLLLLSMSLLLTLNIFHILFWCFHCWLWTSKCRLSSSCFKFCNVELFSVNDDMFKVDNQVNV